MNFSILFLYERIHVCILCICGNTVKDKFIWWQRYFQIQYIKAYLRMRWPKQCELLEGDILEVLKVLELSSYAKTLHIGSRYKTFLCCLLLKIYRNFNIWWFNLRIVHVMQTKLQFKYSCHDYDWYYKFKYFIKWIMTYNYVHFLQSWLNFIFFLWNGLFVL